jgi:hypothetical protein
MLKVIVRSCGENKHSKQNLERLPAAGWARTKQTGHIDLFVNIGKRAAGDFGFAKAPRDEKNRRFVSY